MDGGDPLQVPSPDTKVMTRMTSVPVVVEDNHEVSTDCTSASCTVSLVTVVITTPLSPSPLPPLNSCLCYHCHGNNHYHYDLCHHYHLIAINVVTTFQYVVIVVLSRLMSNDQFLLNQMKELRMVFF